VKAESGPAISVVVPTRDRPHLLSSALAALKDSLGEHDELIVVDSASRTSRTREVAAASGARLVRCDRPGVSLARNAGWAQARHDVVAFVDDDINVRDGWADAIRRAFAGSADLSFVTGRVLLPESDSATTHPTSVEDHSVAYDFAGDDARPRGISGNFAVRASALDRVGGFDVALGPGRWLRAAEDKDLFDRLLAAGLRGRYEPGMLVEHRQWRSRRQRLRLDWSYGIGAGARLAKVLKTDRRRARGIFRDVVVRWGFADLAGCIRKGHRFEAAAATLRLIGIALGLASGLVIPVRNGHYVIRATDGPGRRWRAGGRRSDA
jgi:glycosyltransferase involved in cell wall biosynthesis